MSELLFLDVVWALETSPTQCSCGSLESKPQMRVVIININLCFCKQAQEHKLVLLFNFQQSSFFSLLSFHLSVS